jgi:hypothetical protein
VEKKEIITIRHKAIFQRGQLLQVFVVDSSQMARLRLIRTGKIYGERIEVLSGLFKLDFFAREERSFIIS